jgi:hypothetical protein
VVFSTRLASAICAGTALLFLMTAPRIDAQGLGWSGSAEANASLFFGNTEQWVIAGASRTAFSDTSVEVRGEIRADYAETSLEEGGSSVSRRAWLASVGVDLSPFARLSPFVLGSAESSLQQRIQRRYSAGFGGKVSFVKSDVSSLSTSLALLWEQTDVMDGNSNPDLESSRLRWSFRLKGRNRLDDRLHFTHETFYQPSVREMQRFTLTSTLALTFDLNRILALTSTLRDTYDSEARRRGARSNNDGQLLLGLRARY